jgi:succinate dehydrogenase / fumarate reductase cytochrome b subunit
MVTQRFSSNARDLQRGNARILSGRICERFRLPSFRDMQISAKRPLSPHLQVYRPVYTLALSILHRATGLWISLCSLLFVAWLVAIASGPEAYAAASRFFSSLPVRLAMAAALAAFCYHLFAGVRHLAWDTGLGFERPVPRRTGVLIVVLAAAAFAAILFLTPAGRWLLAAP